MEEGRREEGRQGKKRERRDETGMEGRKQGMQEGRGGRVSPESSGAASSQPERLSDSLH